MARSVTGLIVVAFGLLAGDAAAHVGPDPNVDNRYIKVDISRDLARVVYTIYYADIGALGERRLMDTSGDGQLDDKEQQKYGDAVGAEVLRALRLEIDGAPIALEKITKVMVGIGMPAVAAGSFSIDLEMKMPLGDGAHSLYFDHAWEPARPGETEVFIQAEPGLRVVAAHAGKHGAGVTTRIKWTGSGVAAGDDRSLMVKWVSDDGAAGASDADAGMAPTAGGNGAGPPRMPWWCRP